METTVIIIFAIILGLTMPFLEKWYSKNSTIKTQKIVLDKLNSLGFKKTSKHWELQKTNNKYSVGVTLLRKTNFLNSHSIRFAVTFDLTWEFKDTEEQLEKLRSNYSNFGFIGNFITSDISYYNLSEDLFKELETKIEEAIEVLKKEGLKPIEESLGDEQANKYEDWLINN